MIEAERKRAFYSKCWFSPAVVADLPLWLATVGFWDDNKGGEKKRGKCAGKEQERDPSPPLGQCF